MREICLSLYIYLVVCFMILSMSHEVDATVVIVGCIIFYLTVFVCFQCVRRRRVWRQMLGSSFDSQEEYDLVSDSTNLNRKKRFYS